MMSVIGNIKVLGSIIVFQVPYLFLKKGKLANEATKKERVEDYLIAQFFFVASLLILSLLFFHHKRPRVENKLALDLDSSAIKSSQIPFSTQLSVVFRDPTYVCLLLGCANNQAFFMSFTNNLTGVVTPWGFKEVSALLIAEI